jgi:DNA polymerase-3 subunit epsilon
MKRNIKFLWFAFTCVAFSFIVIFSLAVIFWQQLPVEDQIIFIRLARQYMGYILSAAVFVLAGLGFTLDWFFRLYIRPIGNLVEETRLITSVNPAHRIQLEGGRHIIRLATAINESADRYEALHNQVQDKIQLARAKADEEKNILAAIMAELPEGVLICNTDGQVLLFNKRAKLFLSDESNNKKLSKTESKIGRFIGLGRSVFALIEKHLIVHALDEIADKLKRDEADIASYFVAVGRKNRFLRVEAVPILNYQKDFTGFILIINDITKQLESDNQLDLLLRSFGRGARSSLASIRAAIEAIIEYPKMDSHQLQQLKEIIHQESINVGENLDITTSDYARRFRTRWPLAPMLAHDMLAAVTKKAREKLGIHLRVEPSSREIWIKIDSYSIASALLFLQGRLKENTGSKEFRCRVFSENRFIHLDFIWQGRPVKMETLRKWEEEIITVGDEVLPSTLKEVITHHEAEFWSHSYADGQRAYLRILFPAVEMPKIGRIRNLTILPKSRPEFFDFDLFSQPGQKPELDQRQLSELTYTVFDTETTGLNPKGGDEIISIGAVRIVNNRLLHDECFDRLVDPQRSIPFESTQIHGIQQEMLIGQLTLDIVLPLFHKFAQGTILIAHNAAFDMRMLQLKEAATGVKFLNPVLDTMLLSAVVHPGQKNHNMEGIVERLGTSIVGRHTALGDAIATAEIFLKLIPLLAEQGIYTLRQARSASRKTYYSRLKY